MSKDFFNGQISRLKGTYGDKAFPAERVAMYWERYQNLEALDFKRAIDSIIANNRYAPMGQDFDDALVEPMLRLKIKQSENLTKGNFCQGCNNTGRVSVRLKPGESNYSFRCYCKLGKEMFPSFPEQPKSTQKPEATQDILDIF